MNNNKNRSKEKYFGLKVKTLTNDREARASTSRRNTDNSEHSYDNYASTRKCRLPKLENRYTQHHDTTPIYGRQHKIYSFRFNYPKHVPHEHKNNIDEFSYQLIKRFQELKSVEKKGKKIRDDFLTEKYVPNAYVSKDLNKFTDRWSNLYSSKNSIIKRLQKLRN